MADHTQITDAQVQEWAQVLSPQDVQDLTNGINMTATMILVKLFPDNVFIKEMLKQKLG
jgi:uncharacterized lipoprotein YmbA